MNEAVYEALYGQIWAFVRRRVRSDADADDVTQDVFVRMHSRLGQLEQRGKLAGWAHAIARNAIVDHYRSRSRQPGALDTEPVAPQPEPPDGVPGLADWLAAALPQVPEPYREALALTDLGGMSQQQAAQQLGLSPSGMRSRVQRGRVKLRAVLDACCTVELDRRRKVISCATEGQSCC